MYKVYNPGAGYTPLTRIEFGAEAAEMVMRIEREQEPGRNHAKFLTDPAPGGGRIAGRRVLDDMGREYILVQREHENPSYPPMWSYAVYKD